MSSSQGAVGGDSTPDQQESRDQPYGRYSAGSGEWRLPGSLHYSGPDQPLSDIMPDIALAGAAASFSGLSLSRSVPSPRPAAPDHTRHLTTTPDISGPPALSPDLVVDQMEA